MNNNIRISVFKELEVVKVKKTGELAIVLSVCYHPKTGKEGYVIESKDHNEVMTVNLDELEKYDMK